MRRRAVRLPHVLVSVWLVFGQPAAALAMNLIFTVNSSADGPDVNPGDGACDDGTGDCTLRAAITEANHAPGFDTIQFHFSGLGVHSIDVASALPAITSPVYYSAHSTS